MDIQKSVEKQRLYFQSKQTYDLDHRITFLKKLKKNIQFYEKELMQALYLDLGKSETESYMCEIGMTLSELSYQIKHLKTWARTRIHPGNLPNFHSTSYTVKEPYGVVLVMAPWNYPFMLSMEPMIGAITAGNCCVIKPSAYAPATASVIGKIIEKTFPPEYVMVVQGGREENTALLNTRFDYIFFTGGVSVGKLVMEKAAQNLTPVTLELGGKSPCIVTPSANLRLAAARIAFGKYLNCGQTCVAPDYVLVHKSVKKEFIDCLRQQIFSMYGIEPLKNPDYGKIINKKHFQRIQSLIDPEKVIFGGHYDTEKRQIEPTVLDNVTENDPVMQEEIFGPVLPVLTYENIQDAVTFIEKREKPLALYLFTNDKKEERYFRKYVSFGGGCINDTIIHLASSKDGFGGVGYSGMGSYHGKHSFDTFSHEKTFVKKHQWIDLKMRYQPYDKIKDKLIRWFLN